MATAKHQTSRPVKVGNQLANRATEQRQADKKCSKQQQGWPVGLTSRGLTWLPDGSLRCALPTQQASTDQRGPRQHQQLGQQAGQPPECRGGRHHDPLGQWCGAELAAHGEHRIGHHDQRQQLEAVQGRIKPQIGSQLADTDRGSQ